MAEVFSFDRYHAICRVDTNPQAFKMPTYQMGEVVIAPHAFFMAMSASTIDEFKIETLANGHRRVTMRGNLGCSTEVQQGSATVGSRTTPETGTYGRNSPSPAAWWRARSPSSTRAGSRRGSTIRQKSRG